MNRYRNKLVYDDSTTGEIRDDRNHMSMLEDFWSSQRGGRGTEITTLQGGQNLGEIEDIEYFRNKLYRSLNVISLEWKLKTILVQVILQRLQKMN